MNDEIEIIKIRCGMRDPQGKLIPRGINEIVTVEIADGIAIFYFKDPRITKKFCDIAMELENRRGVKNTNWHTRLQKAITVYSGRSKEEIKKIVLDDFAKLNLNVKKHG